MTVRAKFKVDSITIHPQSRTVNLSPVYSSDENSENKWFSQYTPSGKLEMQITNPNAFNQFEVGAEFYLDFTKVEAAAT